jgi:AraC family transcriptional regulator, transcriptional activator FtrA
MRQTPHRVAILILPSVVPFDLGVPAQVFGYPREDLGRKRYRAEVCSTRKGRVMTSVGFEVVAPHGLEALRRAKTIVVPGIDDLDLPISPAVLVALRAAHRRGARLVSICTGAFVLAEAGLLSGRRATTHWFDCAEFSARFPDVTVDPNVLYVDEGTILTSAGIAAGIDLCLHVVRQDYGADVCNAVARRLVVAPHRSGGQAQFITQPVAVSSGQSMDDTREWMRQNIARPHTISRLAQRAQMSTRSFARRFVEEAGTSPLRWLVWQRVLFAQSLLETTDLRLGAIAERCGFGSEVTLRVHFRRVVGTSPLNYRRSFRQKSA